MADRVRLEAELEADSVDDLAFKLNDLAAQLMAGEVSRQQVFASPSCSGIVRLLLGG